MKLKELLKNVDVIELAGDCEVEISDLVYSSFKVGPGKCFFAIKGLKSDGHDFVEAAVTRGASAVVTEKAVSKIDGCTNVVVDDSRSAMANMSSAFFGVPTKSMKLIGVTGTNGKTTTTYLLEEIFKGAGFKTGVIGTINYRYDGRTYDAPNTTPESVDLHRLFADMRGKNVEACVMEVSSHALTQKRVIGCHFDVAIFTNLTPEHLDYHRNMEKYFEAKAILFEKVLLNGDKANVFSVINNDDDYGKKLFSIEGLKSISYGIKNDSDVMAKDLHFDSSGLKMKIETSEGIFDCTSKLCGRFNALNILSSIAAAYGLGVDMETILDSISRVRVVPGRFESVENSKGVLALVDYAHTPDALENLLKNARELSDARGGKLIIVFGCGGDRDRGKRPKMGCAVGSLSDISIVTSDNPRSEKPESIIDEILPGIREVSKPLKEGIGYEVVVDRRKAIGRAVEIAKKGDVLVVAGKGHEDYQIIGDKRIHFNDREVLKGFLN